VQLKVPSFGESISEVLVSEWLVAEGASVAREANLVVIETDKITSEVPAPVDCRLTRILKQAGETATVGEAIAELEELAAGLPASTSAVPAAAPPPAAAPVAPAPPTRAAAPASPPPGTAPVMPAAERLMAEKGFPPGSVAGSGPGGRILKEDVLRHLEAPPAPAGARTVERVPMSPLRRKVAQHLVAAQQTAALLTTFNEVDMSAVGNLRRRLQEEFQARHGVKLGLMSFFVKAAVEALKEVPAVNARIEGETVVYHDYFDIGIAVGGGKGLVVPVLRGAERLGFAAIEKAIADFGRRAQENKLTLEELTGGTFTISNGGIYGNLLSTPIVNAPQSGILGLHAIQDRPVAREGQVVIRPMMYVALTYDHRLIDGREAVGFLKHIKSAIEEPTRILLEI